MSADRGHEEVPLAAAGAAGFLEPALEAFDASTRIDQLMLAHESQHSDYGQQLYCLLMLELWHRAEVAP